MRRQECAPALMKTRRRSLEPFRHALKPLEPYARMEVCFERDRANLRLALYS